MVDRERSQTIHHLLRGPLRVLTDRPLRPRRAEVTGALGVRRRVLEPRGVPTVADARRQRDRSVPFAADPDRRTRLLRRTRQQQHVVELVTRSVVVERLAAEEALQDHYGLLELREALPRRRERHPGRPELALVPAGPQAELEPSAGRDIDRYG